MLQQKQPAADTPSVSWDPAWCSPFRRYTINWCKIHPEAHVLCVPREPPAVLEDREPRRCQGRPWGQERGLPSRPTSHQLQTARVFIRAAWGGVSGVVSNPLVSFLHRFPELFDPALVDQEHLGFLHLLLLLQP